MSSGRVIERGFLPDGTEYRIWESADHRKRMGYIGHAKGGGGKRRSVKWLRKTLKQGQQTEEVSDVSENLNDVGE